MAGTIEVLLPKPGLGMHVLQTWLLIPVGELGPWMKLETQQIRDVAHLTRQREIGQIRPRESSLTASFRGLMSRGDHVSACQEPGIMAVNVGARLLRVLKQSSVAWHPSTMLKCHNESHHS